ncbi:MAG: NAD(P)/FAD-dependent oxidoreductase [Candidatus Helarchaeota archaeon]
MKDVVIIGAGITGCSTARNLARFELDTLVLDAAADVSAGTTKANSGIIHAGYGTKPGTLKARLNVLSQPMFDKVCAELGVPFKRIGSLVVSIQENGLKTLEQLQAQGNENGVFTEIITDPEVIRTMEPSLSENVNGILFAPRAAIVSPYELAIAMAQNAAMNGVKFQFNAEVTAIDKKTDYLVVKHSGGTVEARFVLNCAGVHADDVSRMVGLDYFKIMPRRGEYVLFDKHAFNINHTLFSLPSKNTKGVLIGPTTGDTVYVGPNAENIEDKEDTSTTRRGLDFILKSARMMVPTLPIKQVIRSYAGLRPVSDTNDFIIETTDVPGFINVAGIQSPGLSACLAIAEMVTSILQDCGCKMQPNKGFNPHRPRWSHFANLSHEEMDELVKKNPQFGRVVCRCETVTEGEIVKSLQGPIGATTLDGVKFRTRAGMGRCQGGFCTSRVIKIIERELKIPLEKITKNGPRSPLFMGRTKEILKEEKTDEDN